MVPPFDKFIALTLVPPTPSLWLGLTALFDFDCCIHSECIRLRAALTQFEYVKLANRDSRALPQDLDAPTAEYVVSPVVRAVCGLIIRTMTCACAYGVPNTRASDVELKRLEEAATM